VVSLQANSYAKLNLHLDVGAKRADNFHPISSLFQRIDLFDTISISLTKSSVTRIRCIAPQEVPVENTMNAAALLFLANSGHRCEIVINCTKQIPPLSGLGGGSSNAATVLLLLNKAFNQIFSLSELMDLGSQIGSDVPFFIGGSALAYVSGRGEVVEMLPSRAEIGGLLVIPQKVRVSTAAAYTLLDEQLIRDTSLHSKEELAAIYQKPTAQWSFSNDFLAVSDPIHTKLMKLKGESFANLSGSGSAFYYLSESEGVLKEIRAQVVALGEQLTLYPIKCLHPSHLGATV